MRRLDRAFRAFFRRVKAGETPGYPRFKGAITSTRSSSPPTAMASAWPEPSSMSSTPG